MKVTAVILAAALALGGCTQSQQQGWGGVVFGALATELLRKGLE